MFKPLNILMKKKSPIITFRRFPNKTTYENGLKTFLVFRVVVVVVSRLPGDHQAHGPINGRVLQGFHERPRRFAHHEGNIREFREFGKK